MLKNVFALVLFSATTVWITSSPASAAFVVDINGGSSWGGWNLRGQSTDLGIYGSGPTTGVYNIYTTSFFFNGQTESGSPAFGGLHRAAMDLSGWNPGARILGVGVRTVSGLPGWGGSGPWNMRPFIYFDLNSDSYQAASTVGGTDGRTSSGNYAHAGDFNVQLNGDNNNLYRPSGINRYTDNGTFWSGSGSFTNYGGSTPNHATTVWPHVRSFFDPSNGSWQVLFNLDTLQTNPGFGTIGNDFRIVTHLFNGGSTTAGVLNVTIVPEPGTSVLFLVGLASFAARFRRR